MNSTLKVSIKSRALRLACASVFAGFGVLGATAHANDNVASADATATVIQPITITKTTDLGFGSFAAPRSGAGTVVMAPGSTRTHTGSIVLSHLGAGQAAAFNVAGEPNANYAITLPNSVTLTSGVNSMTVDTFVSTPSSTSTLSGTGTGTIEVGATLHVAQAQPAGTYAGSFNVTVDYN